MNGQLGEVVQEKILLAMETQPPALTRRDVCLPTVRAKAFAVIGMRRSGKTTFLHQCRADLLAKGRPASHLVYFNFEDERLGELTARQLTLIQTPICACSPSRRARRSRLSLTRSVRSNP